MLLSMLLSQMKVGVPQRELGGPQRELGGRKSEQGGPERELGGPKRELGGPKRELEGPKRELGGPKRERGSRERRKMKIIKCGSNTQNNPHYRNGVWAVGLLSIECGKSYDAGTSTTTTNYDHKPQTTHSNGYMSEG